jgi:hypothetical protein
MLKPTFRFSSLLEERDVGLSYQNREFGIAEKFRL